jgi:hypothetical protein
LAEQGPHSARPEGVLDLLHGDARFLPVVEQGVHMLIGLDTVAWIAVSPSGAVDDDGLELYAFRRPVVVELSDGTTLEGELLYSARPGETRVVDYLNGQDRYFVLWVSGRNYYVAKPFVARVIEATSK